MSLFVKNRAEISNLALFINWLILSIALILFATYTFTSTAYNFDFGAVYEYKSKFIKGFYTTLFISFFSLLLSVILGLVFTYFKMSKIIILNCIANLYVEIIRSTPLLVQILLFYYVVADSFGLENRYVVGIFILSFFNAAYLCEIFRASITSIPTSQYECAKAIGLSQIQIYIYVIIPQALKRTIPPLTNQFAGIIKDSSLLSVISVNELTMVTSEINSYTFSTLEAYMHLAIAYLIITIPISLANRYLEKKLTY